MIWASRSTYAEVDEARHQVPKTVETREVDDIEELMLADVKARKADGL